MKSLSCPDRRCSRSRKSAARSIIQFREALSGIEIWTRSQDPSYASWSDPTTTDVRASNNVLFTLFESVPSVSVAAWRMPLAA